jgi:hypothetical protein
MGGGVQWPPRDSSLRPSALKHSASTNYTTMLWHIKATVSQDVTKTRRRKRSLVINMAFHSCQIRNFARTRVSASRAYLAGTAALVGYREPSAVHQEEPYQGVRPSCRGAYEMVALEAAGIHSELPLVSDSCELGHFHPTGHWKGGEASECSVGLQAHSRLWWWAQNSQHISTVPFCWHPSTLCPVTSAKGLNGPNTGADEILTQDLVFCSSSSNTMSCGKNQISPFPWIYFSQFNSWTFHIYVYIIHIQNIYTPIYGMHLPVTYVCMYISLNISKTYEYMYLPTYLYTYPCTFLPSIYYPCMYAHILFLYISYIYIYTYVYMCINILPTYLPTYVHIYFCTSYIYIYIYIYEYIHYLHIYVRMCISPIYILPTYVPMYACMYYLQCTHTCA